LKVTDFWAWSESSVMRLKCEAKLSHEKIAAATGMSKGSVTNTVHRAVQKGLGWPLPADLDESRLEALLYNGNEHAAALSAAAFTRHPTVVQRNVVRT
jgi:hypothetical protein